MYIQNSELKLDKGIYVQRKNWSYEAKIALAKGGLKNGMFIGIARYTSASAEVWIPLSFWL